LIENTHQRPVSTFEKNDHKREYMVSEIELDQHIDQQVSEQQ